MLFRSGDTSGDYDQYGRWGQVGVNAPANKGQGGGDDGGSGVVIFKYPSSAISAISVSPGTNTKTTAPNGDGIATFTVPGTFSVASKI